MRIAIEAQRIFRSNKHGMDFVALETIREIQKIDHTNEYYILVMSGPEICLKDSDNMHIKVLKGHSYPFWEQVSLPLAIKEIKPDILHCTANTAPIILNVPLILTLHDIIFLEKEIGSNTSLYQQLGRIYRRLIVPNILKKCKKIITVSEFEKDRIKKSLCLEEKEITYVYNSYSNKFKEGAGSLEILKKYINSEDYFFFLANTDPKKNTIRTLRAYSQYLKQSTVKRKLLLADSEISRITKIVKDENIDNILHYITVVGYIPNNDLISIYNYAFCMLYTSLRESFGIPMLESMACGTPVITGNSSSMPEVAGKGGCCVNTSDEDEICNAMLKLETDKKYYESQRQYGLERVKDFSWKRTATEIVHLYTEMVNINKKY